MELLILSFIPPVFAFPPLITLLELSAFPVSIFIPCVITSGIIIYSLNRWNTR